MTEKILVAGGTGRTGQIIVSKLVANGVHPHVLVRDIAKAEALFGEEVILHVGNVRNPDTLIQALQGINSLICAVGTCTPVGENCPKHVDYEGVANLVKATQWSGVKRFILISSIAVTHPEHPLNRFGKILDWKRRSEEVLRQSRLDYIIIRPGGLIDEPGGGRGLIFSQGDQILGTLSREDLAEICLQALQHPNLSRVTFEAVNADKKRRSNWVGLFAPLLPD